MQDLNFIKLKSINSPRNKLFVHELKTFSNPERSRDRDKKDLSRPRMEYINRDGQRTLSPVSIRARN